MNAAVIRWGPSVAGGLVTLVLLWIELNNSYYDYDALTFYSFLLLGGVAVGAARHLPAVALAAVWAAGAVQLLGSIPVLISELAFTVVLFCAARWGSTVTLVLSGLSVSIVPLLAFGWMRSFDIELAGGRMFVSVFGIDYREVSRSVVIVGGALLGLPWLAGLSLRFLARAQAAQEARETAELDAAQAQEIAHLREEQNRLARDVHDVVGHSLAVILAQAESAQFIDDAAKLKETMANIATSARTSLRDVRYVLTPDKERLTSGRLDALVEDISSRTDGVSVQQHGLTRPLPPELEQVAYRVLQEMLTNAIKHGSRGTPIDVELAWPEDGALHDSLRIEVANLVDPESSAVNQGTQQGLDGMRRRLRSVGGHLDIRRRETSDGETFTITAWVPVRDEGGVSGDGA